MPQKMSISVNGQSHVPPGFRFHPTEEELLNYYLRKKISFEKIDLDVIREVDLNKLEPWDIQETCRIGTTPQNDWYFFSHKDKKYPTGTRTNRATTAGFWKATGRDKVIYSAGQRIGMRKTLVFYIGRAPHGQKSDWIMHEYRLDDNNASIVNEEATLQEEAWVVCRTFKKKNHHKTLDKPLLGSLSIMEETKAQFFTSGNGGGLDQVFQYAGGACEEEEIEANDDELNITPTDGASICRHPDGFMIMPGLESQSSTSSQKGYQSMITATESSLMNKQMSSSDLSESGITSWAALDRLVASQLNGQNLDTSRQSAFFADENMAYGTPTDHHLPSSSSRSSFPLPPTRPYHGTHDYNNEIDLWYLASRLSSDPLCHVSNFHS